MGQQQERVEWRSAMTTSGGQSVMISGPLLMPELSVGNLGIHMLVSKVNKEVNQRGSHLVYGHQFMSLIWTPLGPKHLY